MLKLIRHSLASRILIPTTAVLVLGMGVLTFTQANMSGTFFYEQFREAREEKTLLLATQMIGSVKWKKPDLIAKIYEGQAKDPDTYLSNVIVWNKDEEILSQFSSKNLESVDIVPLFSEVRQDLDRKSLLTVSKPHHFVSFSTIRDPKSSKILGYTGMAWSTTNAQERMDAIRLQSLLISGLIVVIVVGGVFYLLRLQAIKPVKTIEHTMKELLTNNNTIIPYVRREDELGSIAQALELFKLAAQAKERLEEDQKQAASKLEAERKKTMREMAEAFQLRIQGIISGVSAAATELAFTSSSMSDTINESNHMVQKATDNANQTSDNVQQVAMSAKEMSSSVQEVSSQIQRSNSLVGGLVQTVENANNHAQSVSQASAKVQEVMKLIADIAGKINLLSLNATIESATAGAAGKGFAVVAAEIKNLANQTDKSIQDIEKVIGEMNGASNDIVHSLTIIKGSVDNLSGISNAIANAAEEQSASTTSIAGNMQNASTSTHIIADNLRQVNQRSTDAHTSSQQVMEAAQELSRQAEQLNREVGDFLRELH